MEGESQSAQAQPGCMFERLRTFFRNQDNRSAASEAVSLTRPVGQLRTSRHGSAKAIGAVLVPIFQRDGTVCVLYTRRAQHLLSHSGEVAFPGGKFDPSDGDLLDTALRETSEEVGLEREAVEVLGKLPFAGVSRSGVAVTPFVGIVRSLDSLRPNPAEVAEVFSVPLDALGDPSRRMPYRHSYADGSNSTHPGIKYRGRVIWGLTLRITMTFLECVERAHEFYRIERSHRA
jgi:8-oxo-dGTP pyrophosphatase MutT (NUDIX family)